MMVLPWSLNRRRISNSDAVSCAVSTAVGSVADAIALLDGAQGFVIGGAEIYRQSLALAETLIITEIGHTYACDAFFPKLDQAEWQETAREAHVSAASGLPYAFVTWQRRR